MATEPSVLNGMMALQNTTFKKLKKRCRNDWMIGRNSLVEMTMTTMMTIKTTIKTTRQFRHDVKYELKTRHGDKIHTEKYMSY